MLGPVGHRVGVVIVGTQTLEQSLDIDADLLVTDAVPAACFSSVLGDCIPRLSCWTRVIGMGA